MNTNVAGEVIFKPHCISVFSEISKGLKPQLKAVMQELTNLYSSEDKSYPTAGENPSNGDEYYSHGS